MRGSFPNDEAVQVVISGLAKRFEKGGTKPEDGDGGAVGAKPPRLAPKDLWAVVGAKSRVSEILAGKRAVTKEQARKLADFFHAGVQLFI